MLMVRKLRKSFGGIQAIDGVNLTVEKGSLHGLIGPNGAGKTTLINLLTGFIHCDEGEVSVDGCSIIGLKPHQVLQRGIARSFQTLHQFENMTVLEVILAAFSSHYRSPFLRGFLPLPSEFLERRQLRAMAWEVVERFGLFDTAQKLASELPLGTQKRLELAKVYATGAPILLLDEPAAGLTHEELGSIVETIRWMRGSGKTLMIIEHNMEFLFGLVEKASVMNFGQIIAEGTPAAVKSNPEVITAYLGVEA